MRELERTGAFDRAWLMVVSPTGTGYVNYAAVSILEFSRVATARRSRCSTRRVRRRCRSTASNEGRHQTAHAPRRDPRPPGRDARPGKRPKVVLFGESLGAWTSQDAFVDHGTQGLVDDGVDHAIWIGTPHFSKWKERVLYDDRPDVDRSLIGVFNDIDEWEALDEAARAQRPLRDDHAPRRRCGGVRSAARDPGAGVARR